MVNDKKARQAAEYLLGHRNLLWDAIIAATKNKGRPINAADVDAVLVEISKEPTNV